MIVFVLIVLFVFVYPFVGKKASLFFTLLFILLVIAAFIFLDDAETAMVFTGYGLGIFAAGAVIRYFYQRSKYNSEATDLMNQYNDRSNEQPPV